MRRALCVLLLLFVTSLPRMSADATGGTVVISELYGGGGNTNALYANDYVELHNRTGTPVDLEGWTIGYSSVASSTWTSLQLHGTIAPYHYFLVRYGSGGKPGSRTFPAPDATASTNLARTGGKVRLLRPNDGGVADLIGWGRANAYETRPEPAPKENRNSLTRVTCRDTDNNARDFRIKPPVPRNTQTSGNYCGSSPILAPIGRRTAQTGQPISISVSATDADNEPLTFSAAPLPAGATFTAETRTFDWTPGADQAGNHKVTFKVTDGYRTDSEAVTISVSGDASSTTESSITLDVERQTKRLVATGEVEPSSPDGSVVVRLLRFANGRYGRVAVERTTLSSSSTYSVSFRRPAPGRCLVVAVFRGDAETERARTEESVRC